MKEAVQVDMGQPEPFALSECYAYDILYDKWNNMPDLPEAKIGATAFVANTTLFCVGG